MTDKTIEDDIKAIEADIKTIKDDIRQKDDIKTIESDIIQKDDIIKIHEDVIIKTNKELIRKKRRKERKDKRRKKKITNLTEFKKLGISFKIPYKEPTEIQKLTIPQILKEENIVGIAKTGSGKTLSFVLPIIEKILEKKDENILRALIITPTRELCHQIYDVIYSLNKNIRVHKIIGGIREKKEEKKLETCEILCSTPGKLIKYLKEEKIKENIDFFVIDEFDKMIELNFLCHVKEIIERIRYKSINLFSATFEPKYKDLLELQDVKLITDPSIKREKKYFSCMKLNKKIDNLYSLLNQREKFIVFFSTTKSAKFHFFLFEKIFDSFLLTSDCSQKRRLQNFKDFNEKDRGVLFTTDLSSRGLDFKNVSKVVSFDCPENYETYVHRNGRINRLPFYAEETIEKIREQKIIENIREQKIREERKSYLFLLKDERHFIEDLEIEEENFERRKLNLEKMITKPHLKEFSEKYVKTYERHLTLKGKKYSECLKELKELKRYLNL